MEPIGCCPFFISDGKIVNLGGLEIELDAEAVDEFHDRIRVIAVLHDIDEVLHEAPGFRIGSGGGLFRDSALAQQDGGGEVPQQVGGVGGDGLLVPFGVEELHQLFQAALGGIIPVDKEGPVKKPRSFREGLYRGHSLGRNEGFQGGLDGV